MSLRARVAVTIVLSQVVIAGLLNALLYAQQSHARGDFEEHAAATAVRCVSHGCGPAASAGDELGLRRMIADAVDRHGPDCRYAILQRPDGRTLAASPREYWQVPAVPPGLDRRVAHLAQARVRHVAAASRTGPFADTDLEVSVPVRSEAGALLGMLRMGFSGARLRSRQAEVAWLGGGLTAAALGIGLLLAYFADRRLAAGLRSLSEATAAMAEGDLERRVSIRTGDELQHLGDRFNAMAARLADTIHRLREHEAALGDRVASRTRELERERQKLSGILASVGAGLLVIDRNMRLVWANEHVRNWFGSERVRAGQPCGEVFRAGDRCAASCPGEAVFRTGAMRRCELTLGEPGRQRRFLITTTPIRDSDGAIPQVLELVQEVTRERRLEADLVQAERLAVIGELAAGVAHQMANPLAVISACAERLAELVDGAAANGPVTARVGVMKRHVFRCRQTIDSLLRFSRRTDAQIRPTDLRGAAEEAVAFVREVGARPDRVVTFDWPPHLPPVRADRADLVQALVNVISNAFDATGPVGRVDFHAAVGPREITLAVSDSGPGIPAEQRARIFEPFFTTKAPGRGTGLGLPMSRRLLHTMGGRLTLVDGGGPGATFELALLRADAEASRGG